jgi:DNA modification methylase
MMLVQIACIEENFHYIGIEQDAHYFEIAKQRIEYSLTQLTIF